MRYALTPFFSPIAKNLFDEELFNWPELSKASESWFTPQTDVHETETHYQIEFDLPGIKESDVNVSLEGRTLRVTGERKTEKDVKSEKVHRRERFFGKFERTFTLPDKVNADKIEAGFKDGVLTITIAKAEEVKPKTITIKSH